MNKFSNFKKTILDNYPDSSLDKLTSDGLTNLTQTYNGIPDDYIQFVVEVGTGSIGNSNFSIYTGPIDPDEIFDPETSKELSTYKFIGDNFSGWMLGYDTSKKPWQLVSFNHNEIEERFNNSDICGVLLEELV